MEPESSLPYSEVPATCPYPEPTPSSPHNPLPLPEDPSWEHCYIEQYLLSLSLALSQIRNHDNPLNESDIFFY
jgi:hypothetical protein